MANSISDKILSEIRSYASSGTMKDVAPMCYLYSGESDVDLQEIITNLTFVRLMQSETAIIPDDEAQVARANDVGIWKPMMADYVYFVCLINPNFSPESFDLLFSKSAAYYKEHLKALMDDFAMDLEEWKKGFVGSLFIR